MAGYVFSLFTLGRVPHLHPMILPLVPCPFWGVPQSLVPGPFLRGYPSPRQGYPLARSGWDTPQSGQDGVPPPGVMPRAVRLLQFPAGGLSCAKTYLHTQNEVPISSGSKDSLA